MRRLAAVATGAVAAALMAAAPAGAAPTWLAPVDVSSPGEIAGTPDVAIAPGGAAIAVWTDQEGEGSAIRASIRPPGGPWGAPATVTAPGSEAYAPSATIDAAGDATVIWEAEPPGESLDTEVEAASLVAGGGWGAPRLIGSVGEAVEEPPVLAADAAGDVTVVWGRGEGAVWTVEATTHPVGGGWSAPVPLSVPGEEAYEPAVAVNAGGDAAVVWKRGEATEIVKAAERPAGGAWSAPADVSAAGEEGVFPQVGLDAAGDATVVWERTNAANFVIREADRPAAGAWSVPRRISPGGLDAFAPTLAVGPGDDAVAAWALRVTPAETLAGVASRAGAGAWGEPTTISPSGGHAAEEAVGIDAAGDATVVWTEGPGIDSVVDAARRPAATGAWGTPVPFANPGTGFNDRSEVAVDPDGDALVVWEFIDAAGTVHATRSAAFDAVGPALRSLGIPGSGTVGEPLAFSVAPLDAISPVVATTWSFGDGGSAAGAGADHTYSAPGTYAVTVTAVDAAGNTSSASGQVTIAPAKPPPPPPAGGASPRKLQVKVACPKSAKPGGCKFALQVVSAKPRRVKAKGKGGKAKTIAPTPESAVARVKVGAGKSALLTLVPKPRYAQRLAGATKVLVRESKTLGGRTETGYHFLKLL
jgi:hypothetical protein